MILVTKAEEARISEAIGSAEQRTSGEIVAMITAESSSYHYIAYLLAALIALMLPWPFIYWTWWPVQHIYLLQSWPSSRWRRCSYGDRCAMRWCRVRSSARGLIAARWSNFWPRTFTPRQAVRAC